MTNALLFAFFMLLGRIFSLCTLDFLCVSLGICFRKVYVKIEIIFVLFCNFLVNLVLKKNFFFLSERRIFVYEIRILIF